jgi:dsRNA-specific ribonuclease
LGDTVLKVLVTIQEFHENPKMMEGSLHIERANLINNTFLRRKAFKKNFYEYLVIAKFKEHILGFEN